jgi:hypothetical protein
MKDLQLKLCILAGCLCLIFPTASRAAERYSVSLTRKDSNLYKVDGQNIWVQTRYCYTYAYSEDAALSPYEVVFLESGDKCDVKQVLGDAGPSSGTYEVSVTRESDNLYSTLEGIFIKTSMCYHYGYGDEAILKLTGLGGTLIFVNANDRCPVEQVLTKLRL